jgi:hypothetical protein
MRSSRKVLVGGLLAGLFQSGCATTTDAASDQKTDEVVYCQTDDSTGSRLSRQTSCGGDASGAQALRSMQTGGNGGTSKTMGGP